MSGTCAGEGSQVPTLHLPSSRPCSTSGLAPTDSSVVQQGASWCHESGQFRVYQPTGHAEGTRLRGAHLRKVTLHQNAVRLWGVCEGAFRQHPHIARAPRETHCAHPAPRGVCSCSLPPPSPEAGLRKREGLCEHGPRCSPRGSCPGQERFTQDATNPSPLRVSPAHCPLGSGGGGRKGPQNQPRMGAGETGLWAANTDAHSPPPAPPPRTPRGHCRAS